MSSFFRMRKTERRFVFLLLALSAAAFLPWWREIHLAGMSLFGWWMVALMVFSPTAALVLFRLERKRKEGDSREQA